MKGTGKVLIVGALALAVSSCGRDPGQERLEAQGAPPAAAEISPAQGTETLERQLERLRIELEAGMAGDPERLLAAEAITDGLMEARRPFDWLATGYDLEARLRQLQAMADRVVARLRRNAPLADVEEDVDMMQAALVDLRRQLAAGRGGPAPPTLDSLLAQDPLAEARSGPRAPAPPTLPGADTPETEAVEEPEDAEAAEEPAPPARPPGAPLGQPVRPPADTSGG